MHSAHYPPDRDAEKADKAMGEENLFLYGTLMDPATLSKVLDLRKPQALRPARLMGYQYKLWGPYPALLRGPPNNIVEGMIFKVQSTEQVEQLERYETECYRLGVCNIKLANGPTVQGRTFLWRGDREELREGVFDLKDYQMEQLEKDLVTRASVSGT
jgi:gamma-glutamylcyclotransferase (GGCT)/AIG2-like uncharacterized protein YtfP